MTTAADIKVTLEGETELRRALEQFKASTQRKIARPGVRAATTLVLRAARQRAPKKAGDRTGALRKSLGQAVRTYKHKGVVFGIVGPRVEHVTTDKYGRKVWPVKYAHLVEFGTAPHGKHPGARARPFMRPAYEETKMAARNALWSKIAQNIEKEAKRLAAKNAASGKK